jgi:hypothetical protein
LLALLLIKLSWRRRNGSFLFSFSLLAPDDDGKVSYVHINLSVSLIHSPKQGSSIAPLFLQFWVILLSFELKNFLTS